MLGEAKTPFSLSREALGSNSCFLSVRRAGNSNFVSLTVLPWILLLLVLLAAHEQASRAAEGSGLLAENWRLRAAAHPVPPMGWMSWYLGAAYRTGATEALIRMAADQMETNGWKAAGYRYINLDVGWASTNRLLDGSITWNEHKFPSGLPTLVSQLHGRGFRVGIYTEPNVFVHLKDGVGSLGHFEQDAQTFADWNIDYIKFDPRIPQDSESFLQDFTMAVAKTGRPMFLHAYLQTDFGPWVPQYLNSFRKGLDIAGSSPRVIWTQFMSNLCGVARQAAYVRPGFYLDMETIPLSLGNGWYQTEMLRGLISMYAILASPMIVSTVQNPVQHPTDALAQDRDIIAINQDQAVHPPRLVLSNSAGGMIWVRPLGPLTAGEKAVCLFNSNLDREAELVLQWEDIQLEPDVALLVYDCWFKTNAFAAGLLSRRLPPGSAAMLKLIPWKASGETWFAAGSNYLSDFSWSYNTSTNGAGSAGATHQLPENWTSEGSLVPIARDQTAQGESLSIGHGEGTRIYPKGLALVSNAQVEFDLRGDGSRLHFDFGFQAGEDTDAAVLCSIYLDGELGAQENVTYGQLIPVHLAVQSKTNLILSVKNSTADRKHRLTVGSMILEVPVASPRLTWLGLNTSQLEICVSGRRNQLSVLERSSDLSRWEPVATNLITEIPWIFRDRTAPAELRRFYRAVVPGK